MNGISLVPDLCIWNFRGATVGHFRRYSGIFLAVPTFESGRGFVYIVISGVSGQVQHDVETESVILK